MVATGRLLKISLLHALFILLLLPLAVSAATLDDHYLAAFGARSGSALKKTALSMTTSSKAVRSGTPIRHGLKRDWKKLQPSTQKALASVVALPTLSGAEQLLTSSGGHFRIHYTTSGTDAPNITAINQYTGLGLTSIADWATQVANSFESAYTFYFGAGGLGYHLPPNFPGAPYDVYLRNLVPEGAYGFTQSLNQSASSGFPFAFTSYIEIDRDFTDTIFHPTLYNPLQSLQVTSVHEFHHAVQYGYNFYFDVWYAEATSTWMEGELYPSIKQLYGYVPGWLSNSNRQIDLAQSDSTFNAQAYGRWILNRYLTEQHGSTVVRSVWEKMATLSPSTSPTTLDGDIQMIPVLDSVLSTFSSSLGADFFGLTKRIYQKDWTTHTADASRSELRYSPVQTFSSYPVAATSVTLPHYSFAFYKFFPSVAVSNLSIAVSKSSGIQTAVFKNAAGTVSEISAAGGSYTVSGFGSLNASSDEVVLLVANTSNADGNIATFSTTAGTQTAINGVCGSADNASFSAAPAINLCQAGTAGTVSGQGPWSWSCAGTNGGTTASCSASVQTVITGATITSGNGTVNTLNELALTDPQISPATKPSGFTATGAVDFTASVTPGSEATFQLLIQSTLPANPVFYKVVGTNWIQMPAGSYTLAGNVLTFKVTDNSSLDSDPVAGSIKDPLVVGFETAVTPPVTPATPAASGGGGGGGCFIATAAYGSYLHPKVAELRAFRDRYLMTNAPGRAFVALYYRLSPPVAHVIAQHEWMRAVVRLLLAPVVLAVEHPGLALLALYLCAWGLVSRRVHRRRRFNKFIHLH
jgi:hypothetical protein